MNNLKLNYKGGMKLKRIVLLCANGMSTSMLARKMIAYSEQENYDYKIEAHPIDDVMEFVDVDCILLGPQVKFLLGKVRTLVHCPADVIDNGSYGNMDGKAVLEYARKLMEGSFTEEEFKDKQIYTKE